MVERETSRVPQSYSRAPREPGTVPEGSSRSDMTQSATTPDLPKRSALQLLIILIRKKPGQPNPSPPSE